MDLHRIQAEKEILAKIAGRYFLVHLRIGRRQHAHVHTPRLRRAHTFEFARFQHAQQLGLLAQGNVGDLIEKQRAVIGKLESADAIGAGVCECAFYVAEDLALERSLGQSAGIDGDQRHARARRCGVQELGNNLLAGPMLAGNQDVGVGWSHLGNEFQHRAHGGRTGDEFGHAFGAQQPVFELQLPGPAQGLM